MAASATDKFRKASNGTRLVSASLASPKTAGSTSATLTVSTGWNTSTGVDLIIYRRDSSAADGVESGSKTDWVGVLSGTALSGMVLKAGTEPVAGYPADSDTVVVATPTAAWADDMVAGILTHADQDGTLKAGAVDGAGVLAADVVTSTKIAQNAVQADDLATNAIKLARASITTTFTTTSTTSVQVTGLTASPTIPAGGRDVEVEVFVPTLSNSAANRIELTLWGGTTSGAATPNTGTQLQIAQFDPYTAGAATPVTLRFYHTPAAAQFFYNVGLKVSGGTGAINCGATFPASLVVKVI